jgi:hypothetical protein
MGSGGRIQRQRGELSRAIISCLGKLSALRWVPGDEWDNLDT